MELEKDIEEVSPASPPDFKSEIIGIVRSNLTPILMRNRLLDYHANDIASAMPELKKEERSRLFSILDAETLASIFEYSEDFFEYIEQLNVKKRIQILSCLDIQTVVEQLNLMNRVERNMLIDLMDDEVKKEVNLLCSFDEDEIGSKMTTNYVSISAGLTVRGAMKELIAQAADNDNISKIYVLDDEDVLLGAIDLKELIIARDTTELDSIITTSYPYVYAEEQIDECLERIKAYSEDSIPVLDSSSRMMGILTAQVISELVEDELGDDYARLAGLTTEEDLHEPIFKSMSKRIPWLAVLLVLGMVVSGVVGIFENVVAHLAIIVSFQSLVLGMAGNAGTQSLAVTIRVLMDEQVDRRQKLYLIGKEARVGLLNGFLLGICSFILVGLYLFLLQGDTPMIAFSVSACTGAALILSMFLSSIAGTSIPMLFKKIGVDPAVASGPLITTVNDLVAVLSYYGLSWLLLIKLLQI